MYSRADATIVGLADPSAPAVARLIAHQPALAGLPVFQGYAELFEAVALDAVLVATPHTLHAAEVGAALERGMHVLCEKPLVCDPAQARQLITLAEARDRVLMVSYQRHCDPGYHYIKQLITSGALGELRSLGLRLGQNWRQMTGELAPEPGALGRGHADGQRQPHGRHPAVAGRPAGNARGGAGWPGRHARSTSPALR
ncbi:MAG: Gfo/Idh/MocA family oxidoreductase [Kouleothrix sp.]